MFKNLKISTKFFLMTLMLSVISSVVVALFINQMIKKVVMERAKTYVAEFVQLQAKKNIGDVDFFQFKPNTIETDNKFQEILDSINTEDILRIKVWAANGDVIFSDNKDIVGKNFADNEEYQGVMANKETIVDIKEPSSSPENIAEQGYKQLMEIYIPIFSADNTRVLGIIEAYYKIDTINTLILQAESSVILIIASINILFFVVLILFFNIVIRKPIVDVVKVANEISQGNMNVDIKTMKQDEIGELLQAIDKMRNSLKIVLEEYEKRVSDK